MTFKHFYQTLSGRVGPNYGIGLNKFQELLARLANPHLDGAVIHVAGTNGKGTFCHLTASVLQAAGYKTGLFISPHLQSPCERISINGKNISPRTFQSLCQKVLEQEKEKLNFFEIITAAAFLYFSQQKVQYIVLETGLGGRKDPTNVCQPVASVVTSVGLDHCAILGHSLVEIAREKAGIIKSNIPVFLPKFPREVQDVFVSVAQIKKAPVFQAKKPLFVLAKIDWKKNIFYFYKDKSLWKLPVLGGGQLQNAELVYHLCRYLKINERQIQQGFAKLKISCRFEVIAKNKKIWIFDGAHNPPAIQNLIEFYGQSPWYRKTALVCGFMRDKDFAQMLKLVAPYFTEIFLTLPPNDRAANMESLSRYLERRPNVSFYTRPTAALKAAQRKHQTILVSGSFYLAAYLLTRIGARKD